MPLNDIPEKLLQDPEIAKVAMAGEQEKDKELRNSGIMGKFFGIGRSATTNYVGLILLLIIVSMLGMAIASFFKNPEQGFASYSDIFMPIVTTIIGFLIGQKASSVD